MSNQDASDIGKKRGRSSTGPGAPVMVRLPPTLLDALDAYRNLDLTRPSRPEAIRRLVAEALAAKNITADDLQ